MYRNKMTGLSRLARRCHFFTKDENGATAVEFAFIGAPFFALLAFMLLGGHILWLSQSMDTSVQLISRQIRTGQAQAAGMSMTQFRSAVCKHVVTSMNDCTSNLIVDVRRFDGPEDIDFNPPQKNGSISQEGGKFEIGNREDYVIVKVYLAVDYLTSLARILGSKSDLNLHLSATAAFRNEPF